MRRKGRNYSLSFKSNTNAWRPSLTKSANDGRTPPPVSTTALRTCVAVTKSSLKSSSESSASVQTPRSPRRSRSSSSVSRRPPVATWLSSKQKRSG